MTQETWKEELHKYLEQSSTMINIYYMVSEKGISDFISSLLAEQRKEVLDEVKREVEKKQEEYYLMKRQTAFQDTLFNYAVNVLKDISTIIDQLKLK